MKITIFNILCFLFFTAQMTLAQVLDPSLLEAFDTKNKVTYIIQFDTQADVSQAKNIRGKEAKAKYVYNTLKEHAKESQKEMTQFLFMRGIQSQTYIINNTMKVTTDKSMALQIAKLAGVKALINDGLVMLTNYSEERPNIGGERDTIPEWGILRIEADKMWDLGYTGQGVIIGGQDTGYEWEVSPLKKKYKGYIDDTTATHSYHWHDAIREPSPLHADSINPCGFDLKIPCDDNNHGTHTMGTMVGSDDDNKIGVAPGAAWIACRNMDRGYGSPSTYTECFEWFLAPTDTAGLNPDPTLAPHVINNSWGCPEMEGCNPMNWPIMEAAVSNLKAAGTVVVVSAGNSGPNCGTIDDPAAIFGESFTIGAIRANDTIANFSSRGPVLIDGSRREKPDVVAPGHNVRSVIRGGEYRNFSGTSMAGPHVAGLVALLISAHPELSGEVEMIEEIIRQSAIPRTGDIDCEEFLNSYVPNPTYGYGRVNALRAHEIASAMIPEFAPVGAKWVYDAIQFSGGRLTRITECTGIDTIQGKQVKVLLTQNSGCEGFPTAYVWQDMYKIYATPHPDSSFVLIYDFYRPQGELYTMELSPYWNSSNGIKSKFEIKVDTLIDMILDGQTFASQLVSGITGWRQDTILAYIGSLRSLFPDEQNLCDDILSTRLRCYSAPGIDLKVTSDSTCAIMVSTTDLAQEAKIWPNPASTSLHFSESFKGYSFQIYDALGSIKMKGKIDEKLDIENLTDGIYIIYFDNMKNGFKFVVQK